MKMKFLEELNISLDQYLNFVLVSSGARRAYLATHDDVEMCQRTAKMFDNVLLNKMNSTILVSKERFIDVNSDDLSEILEFGTKIIHPNFERACVRIDVHMNDGEEVNIVTFICPRDHDLTYSLENMERYKEELMNNVLTKDFVKDVTHTFEILYTVDECIKAIQNDEVNDEVYKEIKDRLEEHFDSSDDDERDIMKYIDLKNEFHRGIIITLLLNCSCDVCEQFYPFNEKEVELYSLTRKVQFLELLSIVS